MKLRDFIADALIEVQHGVQNAINRRDREGIVGRISPVFAELSNPESADQTEWAKLVEKVEFNVAVTDATTREAGGEGGLEVLSLVKLKAEGKAKIEQSAVNRIKFSVPVLLPVQVTQSKG